MTNIENLDVSKKSGCGLRRRVGTVDSEMVSGMPDWGIRHNCHQECTPDEISGSEEIAEKVLPRQRDSRVQFRGGIVVTVNNLYSSRGIVSW